MEPSTLIGIAIAIAYFVIQALGRKKKAPPPGAPPRQKSQSPREKTELDEALSEIRRALGWPEEERRSEETAARTEAPAPTPSRTRVRTGKFPTGVEGAEIDENAGFRREEQFAQRASEKLEKRRAVAVRPKSRQVPEIEARIRNPHSLRQEFLIKEILDPPLVLRRRR